MVMERIAPPVYSPKMRPLNKCEKLADGEIEEVKKRTADYNFRFELMGRAWDTFLKTASLECRTVAISNRFSRAMTSLTLKKCGLEKGSLLFHFILAVSAVVP